MRSVLIGGVLWLVAPLLMAAETQAPTPASSALKMTLGLIVVLAVMALISWIIKRLTPGRIGRQSVAKIVGGVSVGTRERVVVVEVADRWIVVGVAPGQVNALANLEAGTVEDIAADSASAIDISAGAKSPFAGWLNKALHKPQASDAKPGSK